MNPLLIPVWASTFLNNRLDPAHSPTTCSNQATNPATPALPDKTSTAKNTSAISQIYFS
jgi:hypothetical protein